MFSLSLPDAYAEELAAEAIRLLKLKAADLIDVRKFAGRCSWAGGFVPGMNAMIAPLWAAISDCIKATKSKSGGARPCMVPVVRITLALRWIIAFCRGRAGTLTRTFDSRIHRATARLHMEFDASPWGLGGVLFIDGLPSRFYAQDIQQEDLEKFEIIVGDCACQAIVENLAILIGVRMWLPLWKSQRVTVTIKTDSMAAIGAWSKERSSKPAINAIVREMALDQAEGLYEFTVIEHISGVDNDIADALSRLSEPDAGKTLPACLQWATRDFPPKRSASYWRVAAGPSRGGVG